MSLPDRFRTAEKKVSGQWRFNLFALIELSAATGAWDLVVSAPWIKPGRDGIAEVIDILKASDEIPLLDWISIARIVPLETSDAFVQMLTQNYPAEHGLVSVPASDIEAPQINRAFVITAQPAAYEIQKAA